MSTITRGLSAADIRALADNTDELDKRLDEGAAAAGIDAFPAEAAAEAAPAVDFPTFSFDDYDDDNGSLFDEPVDVPDEPENAAVSSGVSDRERGMDIAALSSDMGDDELSPTGAGLGDISEAGDTDREEFAPPPPPVAPAGVADASPEPNVLAPVETGDDKSGPSAASRLRDAGASAKSTIGGLSPTTKIVGAAALVSLLILGTIFFFAGRGSEEASPSTPPVAQAPVDDAPDPATDGEVGGQDELLQAATVSSSCPEGATATTLAFSADERDAWVCPRAYGLDGAVLNIIFRDAVSISSIRFTPGFNYVDPAGADKWSQYRVITKVRWQAGGQQWVQDIVPARGEAEIILDQPISTRAMSMTILQTVDPSDTVGGGTAGDSSDPFDPGNRTGTVTDATAVQNVQVYGRTL